MNCESLTVHLLRGELSLAARLRRSGRVKLCVSTANFSAQLLRGELSLAMRLRRSGRVSLRVNSETL